MKVQAITLCVHGAHLLSCSLSNRRQFDRWLIVTVPRDAETIALCRGHELEWVTTGILRPDGADLYDGDNLVRVTEEALAQLDPDGWVVLLAENVILPRTFRAQILAAKLQAGCEYRLAGLRHCPDQQAFERLAGIEPWRAVPTVALDDEPPFRMFMRSGRSATVQTAPLALTALTVSDACSPLDGAPQSLIDRIGAGGQGQARSAMVAGYYPGLDLEGFATRFEAVYLQDRHGVKNNDALRRLWADDMMRLAPPLRARVHEPSSDRDIPSGSVDLLCLPGEVSSESLVRCMPLWRRALHPNAVVCGDLYGMAEWPEATATIAQLFGRPRIEPAGFWWTTVKDTALRSILGTAAGANGSDSSDAIQLTVNDASADDVLLSLYSLRKAWRGAIHVTATRPDPTLELQCALLGGAWHMSVLRLDGEPRSAISAGTLAFGTIAHGHTPTALDADRGPGLSPRRLLQRLGLARQQASLVRYQGDPARWTKKDRTARSRMAGDMYRALHPAIRTPADSTVATIVDPSTFPAFKAQWPRWTFDSTPIIVAHIGLDRAELDEVVGSGNARCIEIKPRTAASPKRTLKRLVSQTRTERLILLPAWARPMPGATLFAEQDHSLAPIVVHSSAEVQPLAGVAPLPDRNEPFAACMTLALVRDICSAPVVKHKGSIGAFVNRALRAGQMRWSTCNLVREGWQLAQPMVGR